MTPKITKGPSLKEQVYHYLKKAIISGEIEENKVYSEQWAADLLGVSRTPVREAALQLKQEFFIDILPYKGFQIRSLTTEDIKETFQIRLALEGFCIITIAENSQDVHVQRLLGCLEGILLEQEKLATKAMIYEFMERDEMYHRSIINYTGNERLIATYNDIRSRFELITIKVLSDPGRMEATVQEHFAILEKMRAGRPWEAYQAIQIHLDATQRVLKRQTGNEAHSRAL
jgi:DNA-binding GntR family transcriptional regulator